LEPTIPIRDNKRKKEKAMKKVLFGTFVLLLAVVMAFGNVMASGNPVAYPGFSGGDAAAQCALLGDYQYAYKFDNWTGNNVSYGGISITGADMYAFDWAATHGIGAVIVKAGNGANVWFYDPQVKAGTGLYGYENKEISHVTFCWNPDPYLGEWCSPGYWRQDHHLDSWPVPTTTLYNDVLDPDLADNPTLLYVLQNPQIYGGIITNKVADWLSAQHPDVDFLGTRVEDSCPLN
jgi:hypothetical protein